MDISSAIRLLCEVHTNEDPRAGFTVRMGATPVDSSYHGQHYVEAWETLRRAVDLPVEPTAEAAVVRLPLKERLPNDNILS